MIVTEAAPVVDSNQSQREQHGIDVVDTISPEAFKRDYIFTNTPVVMRKVTANWPAMQKWSFEYFAGLSYPKKIFLEKSNVMQGLPQYEELEYGDFIRRMMGENVCTTSAFIACHAHVTST